MMPWPALVLGMLMCAGIVGCIQWISARRHGLDGVPAWSAGLLATALALLFDLTQAPLPATPWPREVLRCLAATSFLLGAVQHGSRPLSWIWLAASVGLSVLVATAAAIALPLEGLLSGFNAMLLAGAAWRVAPNLRSADMLCRVAASSLMVLAAASMLALVSEWVPAAAPWAGAMSRLAEAALATVLIPLATDTERQARQNRIAGVQRAGRQFAAAVESLPDGIALFDENGRLSLCNDAYRHMLAPIADVLAPGISFDEIVGFAGSRSPGLAAAALGNNAAEVRVDGGRWIEARNLPTPDGGMVAIRSDVSERVRTQAALKDRSERLRSIFETVGDGIVTFDHRGIIESFNRAASLIFGYQPDEVIGRNLSMLIPEPHDRHGDDGTPRNEGGPQVIGGSQLQLRGQRKDGSTFLVELVVTELRRDEGTLYVGVLRDVTERKAIETALLESEQRFKDLAEAASDWFWETGPDHGFTFVSTRVRHALGAKTAAFIGKSLLELALGDEGVPMTIHTKRISEHEPFRDLVCRQSMQDGRVKHLKMSGRPVFEADGRFRGYRGTATDITAEVEARASADRAQITLMAALETMSEGFVLWDAEDRLVLSNEKFRRLFPLSGAVVPGAGFADLMCTMAKSGQVQGARDRVEEWLRDRLYAHRHPAQGLELELATGQWLLASEHVTREGFVVGIYTDITPLKRREQEIARQTALSQAIIDNMPQGISVFDGAMRLIALNKPAQTMFSLPAPPPGSMTYVDYVRTLAERGEFGPIEPDEFIRQRTSAGRPVFPMLAEHSRPDGSTLEVRRNWMADGGFITTYTDISQRKKSEVALREAKEAAERGNRAKAAFLASISHELRTPLNAIIGFSEIMVSELYGPLGQERYLDYARDIYESGSHLLNLINDILDMSKAEAGKIQIEESVLDVAELVQSTLRLVRQRADKANITLDCTLPAGLPALRADRRRFRQILLNLVSNALKFTDEGGRVTVSAGLVEAGLAVEVADTGVGMLPEDLSKAMEPFSQIDSRLSRKYEGTGLGLPLTKALVEAHGGTLDLSSVYGVGTRVTALFPRERVCSPGERKDDEPASGLPA